jgi:hypothetical protein
VKVQIPGCKDKLCTILHPNVEEKAFHALR